MKINDLSNSSEGLMLSKEIKKTKDDLIRLQEELGLLDKTDNNKKIEKQDSLSGSIEELRIPNDLNDYKKEDNKDELSNLIDGFIHYDGLMFPIKEAEARKIFGEKVSEDFVIDDGEEKYVCVMPNVSDYVFADGKKKKRVDRIAMLSKDAIYKYDNCNKQYIYDCVNRTMEREGKMIDFIRKPRDHKDTLLVVLGNERSIVDPFSGRLRSYSNGSVFLGEEEFKESFNQRLEKSLSKENIKNNQIIKVVFALHGAEMKDHSKNFTVVDWQKTGKFFEKMLQLAKDPKQTLKDKTLIFENLSCFQADKIRFENYTANDSEYEKSFSELIEDIAKKGKCKICLTQNNNKNTKHRINARIQETTEGLSCTISHISNIYSVFDGTKPNPKWKQVSQYEKNNFVGGSFAGYGWDGKKMHYGDVKKEESKVEEKKQNAKEVYEKIEQSIKEDKPELDKSNTNQKKNSNGFV